MHLHQSGAPMRQWCAKRCICAKDAPVVHQRKICRHRGRAFGATDALLVHQTHQRQIPKSPGCKGFLGICKKEPVRFLIQVLFYHLRGDVVVEVRGIEPPSESTPVQPSPSASKVLGFPSPHAPWRACGYGSFMITGNASKLWRTRSPHC